MEEGELAPRREHVWRAPCRSRSLQLGHSRVTLTMDTYSHVIPNMQEGAGAAIDAAFGTALDMPR
jgi:hypothetical protein